MAKENKRIPDVGTDDEPEKRTRPAPAVTETQDADAVPVVQGKGGRYVMVNGKRVKRT